MKKNEILELNGVEYTLELNRESYLKIDQYGNIGGSMQIIQENVYEHIDKIEDGINPFEDGVDEEYIEQKAEEKLNTLQKLLQRAFWIWLYPNHKLDISKVQELLEPYFEDDEKFDYLCGKYADCLNKSVEIRLEDMNERKNLKAQINKKK